MEQRQQEEEHIVSSIGIDLDNLEAQLDKLSMNQADYILAQNIIDLLNQKVIDIDRLRILTSQQGIPNACIRLRPLVWKVLLGNLGVNRAEWKDTFEVQRDKYRSYIERYYEKDTFDLRAIEEDNNNDITLCKCISLDTARTIQIFPVLPQNSSQEAQTSQQHKQNIFKRILFVFGKIHTEIGYLSGMNYILAAVFSAHSATEYTEESRAKSNTIDLEADMFFCLTSILKIIRGSLQASVLVDQQSQLARIEQFSKYLSKIDEEIANNFNRIDLSPIMYTYEWFEIMFANRFDQLSLLLLWDVIFSSQNPVEYLNYIALAILLIRKPELLVDDLCTVMMKLRKLDEMDIHKVIKQTASIQVEFQHIFN